MQSTNVSVKKGLILEFNIGERRFETKAVDIPENSNYKVLCNLIGSRLIDVVEYNDEIDIIVDDEGLLISGNTVLEIETKWGSIPLAGKILFLKKEEYRDGIRNVGMEMEEIIHLLSELDKKISLIGVTR